MGNPFIYPKIKHKRTQSPPPYNNYRTYKPVLQKEFDGQCVYCRGLDNKGYETFGVDHYRPKKQFPELANEYLNLYYSCNRCNSLKREYWPTSQQLKQGRFVPNPCEHVMFEHLRYQGGQVVSVSPAGEFSLERLDLNDPEAVKHREGIVGAISLAESQLVIFKKTLQEIMTLLASAASLEEAESLDEKRRKVENYIGELETLIGNLGG